MEYRWASIKAISLGGILLALSSHALGHAMSVPVPKASCGPQDRSEGVQGETTRTERLGSGPEKAYQCNLERVGQFEGEGSGLGMNVFGSCAYYSTWPSRELQHPGVTVLDISDTRHPRATAHLDSPVMTNANDAVEFDPTRQLLLGTELFGTRIEIYDLSADCRYPVLKSRSSLSGVYSHSGQFAPDGRIFYGASYGVREAAQVPPDMSPALYAIDTSNPSNLRILAKWISPREDWRTHGISLNADGTRAYATLMRHIGEQARNDANGLAIFDVSDIQSRRPDAEFRLMSTLTWDDAHLAQFIKPMKVKGRPYLVFSDISGALGILGAQGACAPKKPSYGFARIIDISDEQHPKLASKLMLAVSDPARCSEVKGDPVAAFGYGSFGCDVDNAGEARLLACGYFEGGLRVFDIRNPGRPKEVAYYKPPARRMQSPPGSFTHAVSKIKDHTADEVMFARFLKKGTEIAFNSADNGFTVVRFSDRFRALHGELFVP